ncbi:MAG TPA: triose-phosphate isomerase [Kouleothrix sp.]|uniref:triose-phosphate isomerase n=1 Tax=Kouleothrix sp. TaxID=2779161 RepID=UPI002B976313|nr:triose-phosphate isomerase [Kouleothrix sp.]HRC74053.1 triose-phosphate isomerase [Kouleothrix sp.]
MRIPLLAGNWKMYKTIGEAVDLVEALLRDLGDTSDREVLVCPPYTALHALSSLLQETPIALGAQDVYPEPQGAFTGAIAPGMLADVGCRYVIVGHSERRHVFGEGDALINRKLHAVLGSGLRPILCVGETKPQRDAGEAEAVVVSQVRAGLAGVEAGALGNCVIAYEPVWAIGTGDTATPADAQAMHATIRGTLAELYDREIADTIRIQYGGSVKPDNVDELMRQPDIDGALVGGASLKADSFLRIVHFKA